LGFRYDISRAADGRSRYARASTRHAFNARYSAVAFRARTRTAQRRCAGALADASTQGTRSNIPCSFSASGSRSRGARTYAAPTYESPERLAAGVEVESVHDLREILSEDTYPGGKPVEGEPLPAGHAAGGDGVPGDERRVCG
jgi:hypothetical protein